MVIIEEDKPLPEHTKLRYEECYAKLLLETFIGKFKNIIIQDKPDLICVACHTGVEVTDIMDKNKKEALKLWYTMPYVPKEKQQYNKERMKKLGMPYQGGIQTWPAITYDKGIDSTPYQELYESLHKKLQKFNKGNYKLYDSNEILFFSELWFAHDEECLIVERLNQIQNSYSNKFDVIYVVTQGYLYEFKLNDLGVKKFYIHGANSYLAEKARQMVKEEENND